MVFLNKVGRFVVFLNLNIIGKFFNAEQSLLNVSFELENLRSMFNKMKKETEDKLNLLKNNGFNTFENTRLTNDYKLIMDVSIIKCWNLCVEDLVCNSISFLHGIRKPHFQQNCCFLYSSANPTSTTVDQQFFTSLIRIYPR